MNKRDSQVFGIAFEVAGKLHDLTTLAGNLMGHLEGAVVEENADETFCGSCYRTMDAMRDWLDKNDPTWKERQCIRAPKEHE